MTRYVSENVTENCPDDSDTLREISAMTQAEREENFIANSKMIGSTDEEIKSGLEYLREKFSTTE